MSTCGKLAVHANTIQDPLRPPAGLHAERHEGPAFPPFVARGANANLELPLHAGDFDAREARIRNHFKPSGFCNRTLSPDGGVGFTLCLGLLGDDLEA